MLFYQKVFLLLLNKGKGLYRYEQAYQAAAIPAWDPEYSRILLINFPVQVSWRFGGWGVPLSCPLLRRGSGHAEALMAA